MPGSSSLASPGAGVNATWTYTLGSVVFFLAALDALLVLELADRYAGSGSAADLVLLLAVFVASAVQIRWCWFLRARRLPSAWWLAALLTPAFVAWVIAFARPELSVTGAIPVWLAGSLILCFTAGTRRWGLLALAAVVTAAPVVAHWPAGAPLTGPGTGARSWLIVLYAVGMPFMILTSLWWWRVVLRLDDSRRVAAELAVAQERLRFASDLHDIQGHHLQVIALKSELAERMLDRDPAAAAAQVHEVRVIAKQAMEETRALVAGLREVTLEDELENASEVLSVAGADCVLELAAAPAEPLVQRALALTVREGTTNILRHSDATSAAITLRQANGSYELELTNNGVTGPGSTSPGSGLAGLRERAEALGGTLTHELRGERFSLRMRVPASGKNA